MGAAQLVLGARGSQLARWQAAWVRDLLRRHGVEARIECFTTEGDRQGERPLYTAGGKGLFTKELEEALLDGRIDAAVHSLKDLPTALPEELVVAAIPPRADLREALVVRDPTWHSLAALPGGTVVGTSSLRRQAQLRAVRRDLDVVPIRGNVPTRVAKVRDGEDGLGAALLAAAGLDRLGMEDSIAERIEPLVIMPAPGQGAVAVEVAARGPARALVAAISDRGAELAVRAERAMLARLEGGCLAPIAAYADAAGGDLLMLHGRVTAVDGSATLTAQRAVDPERPERSGELVADALLAQGAADLIRDARELAVRLLPPDDAAS